MTRIQSEIFETKRNRKKRKLPRRSSVTFFRKIQTTYSERRESSISNVPNMTANRSPFPLNPSSMRLKVAPKPMKSHRVQSQPMNLDLNSQPIPIELSDRSDDETIFEEEQFTENMDRGTIISLCSDDDKVDGTNSLKPFQCDLCRKQCATDSDLRRHGKHCLFRDDLIHFQCTECGETTKWRYDIKQHLKTKHGDRVRGCERKEDWDRFIKPISITSTRLVPRHSPSILKRAKKKKKKRSKSSKKKRTLRASKSTVSVVVDHGLSIWKKLVIEPDVLEFKVKNGRSWPKGIKIRNGNRERVHVEFLEKDNRECLKFITMNRQDFRKRVDPDDVAVVLLKPNNQIIKRNADGIDSVNLKLWIDVMNQQKTRKTRQCVRVKFVKCNE